MAATTAEIQRAKNRFSTLSRLGYTNLSPQDQEAVRETGRWLRAHGVNTAQVA